MEKLKIKSTSLKTADIEKDIVLSETSTTRRIFKAMLVENIHDPSACVRGHIIHQRKSKNDTWESIAGIKLSQLKAGEGIKFLLHSEEVKILYDELGKLYSIGNRGIPRGEKEYVVADVDEVIVVTEKRKEFIQNLLEKDYGDEIWEQILEADPDLATKLAHSTIQNQRESTLKEFESGLQQEMDESYWQQFFANNDWIFGYGLNYQFLHLLTGQPNYGGTKYTGKGGQKGDFLTATQAVTKFTVLIEIKKPDTPLFTIKRGEVASYRNSVPLIGSELAGGVSQIQVNCNTWELEGSRTDSNIELQKAKIFTVKPKGILVIGHTNQLGNYEVRNAFELYRRSIYNPEILTFDELYERAKFIVGQNKLITKQ